jgi:hypothetical protein
MISSPTATASTPAAVIEAMSAPVKARVETDGDVGVEDPVGGLGVEDPAVEVVVVAVVVVVVVVDVGGVVVKWALPTLAKVKVVPRQASWFVLLVTIEIGSPMVAAPRAATTKAGVPE